jgi:hypothetical protein
VKKALDKIRQLLPGPPEHYLKLSVSKDALEDRVGVIQALRPLLASSLLYKLDLYQQHILY